jgi:hypothetical protein
MGTIRELSERIVNGLAAKGAKLDPMLMAQVTDMIAGIIEEWITVRELEKDASQVQPPYPWCPANRRVECAARGYCDRDPNCGE